MPCALYGVTADIDEQKQGLIALILDNYQYDWRDICSALKQMNRTNLAREIKIKYGKSKGTREHHLKYEIAYSLSKLHCMHGVSLYCSWVGVRLCYCVFCK